MVAIDEALATLDEERAGVDAQGNPRYYPRDEDAEESGADEALADDKNASPPAGDEAPNSSDDADSEAGRAPEEEQDEEQAASRPAADEQSRFDVMGMLCNTTAETSESAEGPPEPTPPHLHF